MENSSRSPTAVLKEHQGTLTGSESPNHQFITEKLCSEEDVI